MNTEKKKVLGRGLEALLPRRPLTPEPSRVIPERNDAQAPATPPVLMQSVVHFEPGERVLEIPLGAISRNPYQTRTTNEDDPALQQLADSIKAQGLIHPVLVRPVARPKQPSDSGFQIDGFQAGENGETKASYELITGERRWMASRKAGASQIRAIVRELTDQQVLVLTIIENLLREDPNPMQHARALQRLAEEFQLTQEEVAARTGLARSAVANFLRLTRLPPGLQQAIAEGRLGFGQAKVLMSLGNTPERDLLAEKVMAKRLTVRETETLLQTIGEQAAQSEPSPAPAEDPNVRAAALELQRSLGCRVQIKDRHGKGKIVIEYHSLEDFDRIVEALK